MKVKVKRDTKNVKDVKIKVKVKYENMEPKLKRDANNVNMKVKVKYETKNDKKNILTVKPKYHLLIHQYFTVIHFFKRGRVVAFLATTSSPQMTTPFIQGSHQSLSI